MAYYNTWEDLKKEPYYADLSDQELMSLFESFKTDPSTALLMARNSAKARQSANIDKAIQKFYQSQDDFDRTFNPESYNMRRSGLGKISMPVGGRAGMINLHRPQYIEDMNQSIKAPIDTVREHKANQSANSLEAERNHSIGWLKGSEQHRAKLEQSINDYDKEIAKLQTEIAMSESGDPMYNLAIMRLLMDDDNSLLMDIRGRIGKKIDQEFQERMKQKDQDFTREENEKNRQSTEKLASMNRDANKQDKIDAAKRNAKRHRAWIGQLIDQYNSNPNTENRLALVREWLDLQDDASEAGYSKLEEFIGADDYATIMDALGMTAPSEASAVQDPDASVLSFKNAQDFKNNYNSALRKAKTNGNFEPVKNILSNVGTLISKNDVSVYEGEIQKAEEDWKNAAPTRELKAVQKKADDILAKLRRKEIDSNTAASDLKKLRSSKFDVTFTDVYENPDKAIAKVTRKGK